MRMRALSRRYMGDQSSAYGKVHADGTLNYSAAPPYSARRPQKAAAGPAAWYSGIEVRRELAGPGPSRLVRPPRSNSGVRR